MGEERRNFGETTYLVDINGRVAIRSRAFLKPVFKEGQGGAEDHVSQDLRSRGVSFIVCPSFASLISAPREERRKMFFVIMCSGSGNSDSAHAQTTHRGDPRTPPINRWGDFPSSIFNGPQLPLGKQPSLCVPCSFLPS